MDAGIALVAHRVGSALNMLGARFDAHAWARAELHLGCAGSHIPEQMVGHSAHPHPAIHLPYTPPALQGLMDTGGVAQAAAMCGTLRVGVRVFGGAPPQTHQAIPTRGCLPSQVSPESGSGAAGRFAILLSSSCPWCASRSGKRSEALRRARYRRLRTWVACVHAARSGGALGGLATADVLSVALAMHLHR